jgi:hypothetical protein
MSPLVTCDSPIGLRRGHDVASLTGSSAAVVLAPVGIALQGMTRLQVELICSACLWSILAQEAQVRVERNGGPSTIESIERVGLVGALGRQISARRLSEAVPSSVIAIYAVRSRMTALGAHVVAKLQRAVAWIPLHKLDDHRS